MNDLGHKAKRSEQLLLKQLIPNVCFMKKVIIHHVIDTPEKLQIECEIYTRNGKINFKRFIL